nr:type IV secretion system DNA-binding domain-containing protein [Helicobacter cetorum]
MSSDDITRMFEYRTQGLNEIVDGVVLRIVVKRRVGTYKSCYDPKKSKNKYASIIVDTFENNKEIWKTDYYLLIETKNDSVVRMLERLKEKTTTNKYDSVDKGLKNVENTQDNNGNEKQKPSLKNATITYKKRDELFEQKATLLNNILNKLKDILQDYKPSVMSGNSIMNLYAEYCNGWHRDFKYDKGCLTDGYLFSRLSFEKDYFTHECNNQILFKRFIAIKAYDTDVITSFAVSKILHEQIELDVLLSVNTLDKEKAKTFIKERLKRANDISKSGIEELYNLVHTDRVQMQDISLGVMVQAKSKKELDTKSIAIYNIFKNAGFVSVQESINLRPIYFSFFPERIILNSRIRRQSSQNIATLVIFESNHTGFKGNTWGDDAISVFKNQNGSAHFFNFQATQGRDKNDNIVGHTMIIGGTWAGKTTLVSFFIANILAKYDISVVALDRLNGLEIMTDFFNGQYNQADMEGNGFFINPCSLRDTPENRQFIASWIKFMLNIDSNNQADNLASNTIQHSIDSIFDKLGNQPNAINLCQIAKSMEHSEQGFKETLEKEGKKPYFCKFEDCLDFTKSPLSVINMDAFSNDNKLMSLIALYLFHKLFVNAKDENKGFFLFVDETKDYLRFDVMFQNIANALAQARKINGTLCLAFQLPSQLLDLGEDRAKNLVGNLSQVIIYPTRQTEELKRCGIELSDSEINFLHNTDLRSRMVLIKNIVTQSSAFVSVDLKDELKEKLFIPTKRKTPSFRAEM